MLNSYSTTFGSANHFSPPPPSGLDPLFVIFMNGEGDESVDQQTNDSRAPGHVLQPQSLNSVRAESYASSEQDSAWSTPYSSLYFFFLFFTKYAISRPPK